MSYIDRELRLIDERYFSVLDERANRWVVRKWKYRFMNPRRYDWRINSDFVRKICLRDAEGNDVGRKEIDSSDVEALRKGLYNARRLKYLLREIDDANARMLRHEDSEQDYFHRDTAKTMWKHYREPSVYLGS